MFAHDFTSAKRIANNSRFAGSLLVILLLLVGVVATPTKEAAADYGLKEVQFHDDGTETRIWEHADGLFWAWVDADGNFLDGGKVITPGGNPSLEDPNSGLKPDREAFLSELEKLGGGAFLLETDPLKTPAGEIVSQQGGSIVPHHNPSDLFQEHGMGGHGGGFDPNGGPISEQINGLKGGGGGGGGDDDGDGGDDGHKEDYGFHDGQYPANPELVNPVPIQKSFVLLPPSMKGFKLTGPSGSAALPGGAFNCGAFGGHITGAAGPVGAVKIAR